MNRALLKLTVSVCLILPALALGQSWGGTQGSSEVRVERFALPSLYERPGLYFLSHPARLLPPRFASVYPFGAEFSVGDEHQAIAEFFHLALSSRRH